MLGERGGVFEPREEFLHPVTGRQIRASQAWFYERSTQTAVLQTAWEEIDAGGEVVDRLERGPIRLHCVFQFEVEHLPALAGYHVEAVCGDFFKRALTDEAEEMIWVAKNQSRAEGVSALFRLATEQVHKNYRNIPTWPLMEVVRHQGVLELFPFSSSPPVYLDSSSQPKTSQDVATQYVAGPVLAQVNA